jgi:hypothetical protein
MRRCVFRVMQALAAGGRGGHAMKTSSDTVFVYRQPQDRLCPGRTDDVLKALESKGRKLRKEICQRSSAAVK